MERGDYAKSTHPRDTAEACRPQYKRVRQSICATLWATGLCPALSIHRLPPTPSLAVRREGLSHGARQAERVRLGLNPSPFPISAFLEFAFGQLLAGFAVCRVLCDRRAAERALLTWILGLVPTHMQHPTGVERTEQPQRGCNPAAATHLPCCLV